MRALGTLIALGTFGWVLGCGGGSDSKKAPDGGGSATPDGGGLATPDGGGSATPDGGGLATPDGGGLATPDGGGLATLDGGGTTTLKRNPTTGECTGESSGKVCTGEAEYQTCLISKCDAQFKACLGNDYSKGTFLGPCADFMKCEMNCPCDATSSACALNCYTAAGSTCVPCLLTANSCMTSAGCIEPVCTPGTSTATLTSTSTATLTSTSTLTATLTQTSTNTSTGTGCAAAQACCQALASAAGAAAVQQCQAALAGLTDAACAQAVSSYKLAGLCP
jgi:hypothetical protein